MATFYDRFATRWEIRLTVGAVLEFQKETGISLLGGENLPQDLPAKLLAFLLRDGVARRYKTADKIKEAFPLEVRKQAKRALCEEFNAFFPRGEAIRQNGKTEQNAPPIEEQIWKLGGALGIDIRPFRLSELILMARGAQEERWGRLSALMALLVNLHRGKNSPAARAQDFNPTKKGEPLQTLTRSELAAIFRKMKRQEKE